MAQRRGMLAAANQFTPMTNKNVQNAETPMCLLKMQDLITPKLNKNSSSPKEDKRFRSPTQQPLTPATEVDVDSEVPSPKFSPIQQDATLGDIKSLLLTALNYIEKLEKTQNASKGTYADAQTQTSDSSRRKKSSSDDRIPRSIERAENIEPVPRQVERPKKKEVSREQKTSDRNQEIKPILKKQRSQKSKEEPIARASPMDLDDEVNEIEVAVQNLENRRKSIRSSDEDLTEMKTSTMSKKSSFNSQNSTWSTDSDGKNLQERMHQMSIILRNLEMQLDDISTKK